MGARNCVYAFLGKHGAATADINSIIDAMLFDMEEGLRAERDPNGGKKLSPDMDMIPTWMRIPESIPENEPVVVIDAGGTNFRSCLVTFGGGENPVVENFEKRSMPGIEKEYSKKEFFETIASYLDHLKRDNARIGFCFSYPMRITPEKDGEVIAFSKEIKAAEVVGSLVGKSLADALEDRGWNRPSGAVLLNDTAAALLAGAATARGGKSYSSYAGFILGTGTNTAYMESSLPKVGAEGSQIVVCESGKFGKMARSEFDKAYDAQTNTPGLFVFEKMSSGAYIGPVADIAVKTAAAEGLFSSGTAAKLTGAKRLDLIDVDKFLHAPEKTDALLAGIIADGTQSDRETLYFLLDFFVDRSARLAAANIASAVVKSGAGFDPSRPVCVLCEGTTFLKTHALKRRVWSYLYRHLTEERGVYFELVSADNAITLGTAIAGLTQR